MASRLGVVLQSQSVFYLEVRTTTTRPAQPLKARAEMAKFRVTNYSPKNDSSPMTEAMRNDTLVGVILDLRPLANGNGHLNPCPCGCRQPITGKSVFRMGHDMRLKGILIRAHLTGTPIHTVREGDKVTTETAMDKASYFNTPKQNWEEMLKVAKARQGREIEAALARAKARSEETVPGTVKAGRWEYPARKTGEALQRNTKRDGSGEWIPCDGKFVPAEANA